LSILNPINDLVAWVIMHIYGVIGPVFGVTSGLTWVLSIALLVIAMRLIMLPLFIKQMHTQRAMTALTPKISELRKKHKGDKEKLNQETMKLYQEAGVNPLMGCLPVVLQMPLFFALFSVLRAIAEYVPHTTPKYNLTTTFVNNVNQSEIFGVKVKDTFLHGTSLHVHIVVALVVLVSMGTTYLTVRQSMKRGMMPTGSDSPMGQSQKLMAYVMPLFALTGLYWPFGLVMYWVMTNLWTLGQQYVLLRKYPVGAAASAVGGNLPINNKSGQRPATAAGLTSGSGQAKPSTGSKKPKPSAPVSDSVPTDTTGSTGSTSGVQDAVPDSVASSNGQASANGKKPATAKPASTKPATAKPATAKAASDKATRPPKTTGSGGSPNGAASGNGASPANGHKPAEAGGVLRRFGRRPEPEPPAEPEQAAKIVRQQPQRQSRSKRSGKR
jgi:YidC/Oxa1 family membrane protein insertase